MHIYDVTGIVHESKKSHVIVEILLNNMGMLAIISVFPMIYLQSLWYAWICLNTILQAIIQTKW